MYTPNEVKQMEAFQIEYKEIDDLEMYFEFLEKHYRLIEVEIVPEKEVTNEEVEFPMFGGENISIISYKTGPYYLMNFIEFRFDFIKKLGLLIDSNFKSPAKGNIEKIEILKKLANISDQLQQYHDIQDPITLVSRLAFKIDTQDHGIILVNTFSSLVYNNQFLDDLRNEFNARKYFFAEAKNIILDAKEKIKIFINKNELLPQKENNQILRYLVYELAAGIQAQNLIALDEEQKRLLEDKLFKVLNIDSGKRSKIIGDINARKNTKALTLENMVSSLQERKFT
jgi:hypothetical protein